MNNENEKQRQEILDHAQKMAEKIMKFYDDKENDIYLFIRKKTAQEYFRLKKLKEDTEIWKDFLAAAKSANWQVGNLIKYPKFKGFLNSDFFCFLVQISSFLMVSERACLQITKSIIDSEKEFENKKQQYLRKKAGGGSALTSEQEPNNPYKPSEFGM